ncbi:MAG: OmpH family outer membrane protein [Pyramidobacter sp.]|nr:OmpH family outer membrane protein [Pyramidobacter sp.]MBP3751417.1 OmpH family outer membrane protein [Pyramidobacter sp.]MBQ8090454.1 OmpH family outer membrane protein [Pyramidobacter sp.]MBR0107618.1 OmpH family outer membrane protein [Pyramidobacter sp.]MBR1896764.1 OmpH family outer membrane protein [Pyramidobacter sp.]
MKICVVDVARVFAQSKPADEARKHLTEVQGTLKAGLDEVVELYKDNVASPEAQNAIAQARNLLQQQMNVEQQAADAVVRNLLVEVTEEWRKEHDDVDMIVARQQLVFCKPELDITGELIEKINEKTPKFPDLPKVSINKNK